MSTPSAAVVSFSPSEAKESKLRPISVGNLKRLTQYCFEGARGEGGIMRGEFCSQRVNLHFTKSQWKESNGERCQGK